MKNTHGGVLILLNRATHHIVVCNSCGFITTCSSSKKVGSVIFTVLLYATKMKFNTQPALVVTTFWTNLTGKAQIGKKYVEHQI